MKCGTVARAIAILLFGFLARNVPGRSVQSPRLVSMDLTYDSSVPQRSVWAVEDIFRRALDERARFRVVLDDSSLTAHLTALPSSRRALIADGRRAGADYAVALRLSRVRVGGQAPFTRLSAWVASPDSEAYVSVSEALWEPGDTLAARWQVGLLVDRLIPRNAVRYCYAELGDQAVRRDETSVVLDAKATVRVRTNAHGPAQNARVWGHWLINAEPAAREEFTTDDNGTASVHLDASGVSRPIGDASFVVDSVQCVGAVYDQQAPQRQVDRALALLENARAELDEEKRYDNAVRMARTFLNLSKRDIAWYTVLMMPLDAPDRRQQAVNIMRRAEYEKNLAELPVSRSVNPAGRFRYGAWLAIDVIPSLESNITAQPVRCDTCEALSISPHTSRRVEAGVFTRIRVLRPVWLGVGASWGYQQRSVPFERRDVVATAISSTLWLPHKLKSGVTLYGEIGGRLVHESVGSASRYWADGVPHESVPAEGTYWVEPETSGGFRGGGEMAIGANYPMSDWQPIWMNVDLRALYDRLAGNRHALHFQARFSISYGG